MSLLRISCIFLPVLEKKRVTVLIMAESLDIFTYELQSQLPTPPYIISEMMKFMQRSDNYNIFSTSLLNQNCNYSF